MSQNRGTILVVEEEQPTLRLLQLVLSRHDYVKEGIRDFITKPCSPDVILKSTPEALESA